MGTFRGKVERLLSIADVNVNGDRPWDIQIHNESFYRRLLAHGSLGLGESYMDGWWDCERPDEFIDRIFRADLGDKVKSWKDLCFLIKAKLCNLQRQSRAFEVGKRHYDIGNTLYRHMLDSRMIYSCGYWKNATTLDQAQEAKLDLVCRKLHLQEGMRVLDIGCGWGGTAKFAAERCGVEVVGVTVSEEQAKHARRVCRGLPVTILLQDYRTLEGTFDRILSLGMFEHVGYKNYPTFMRVARKHLKNDGLFLLHTIGGNNTVTKIDSWTNRYIFPNAMLPSAKQINSAMEGEFVLEDWHNFGADYDKTLMHWFRNFEANWHLLKKVYDERFYRMWKYYLLACAAGFRARKNQLWQIVFSPDGIHGGYHAPR